MTWKDKLEIGLKNDAPFRKDNLAPDQVHGPEIESGPGRSPVIPEAQHDREQAADPLKDDKSTDREPNTEQRSRPKNETPKRRVGRPKPPVDG